mmetsp:Transcript_89729/g.168990  ORF Transcript_89729/g.168990 Transcript_89729/m.168990 type:complete len:294 (+) Transcript_89729:1-882(+)
MDHSPTTDQQQRRRLRWQLKLSGAFAFVNGWIDAISLRRYHAFVTMMVGNTLTMGNSVGDFITNDADPKQWVDCYFFRMPDPLLYVLLVIAFMLGVGFCRLLELKRGWSARHFAPLVVGWIIANDALEGALRIGGCAESDSITNLGASHKLAALRLAPVFGIQDALSVKGGMAALPWCTTGNVVNIAYHTAEMMVGKRNDEQEKKWNTSVVMLSCMLAGAISGACFEVWRRRVNDGCNGGDFGILVMAPFLGFLFWCHDILYKPKSFSDRKKPARGLSSTVIKSFPKLLETEK